MKKASIIVLTFAILVLAGCGKINYTKLEDDFKELASKYYDDNIKGFTTNINNHQITIAALEDVNVDVSKFIDAKCDKESYVLIKLELDEEGKQKGEFETEVHLTCDDYTKTTE